MKTADLLFLLLPLCLLALAGISASAAPVKHPVLDHGIEAGKAAAYEAAVAPIMAMSEEKVLSYVSPFGYVQYCECPNCYGGVEGNGIFLWSNDRPDELKCRFCSTVAYPNPKYPEEKVLVGKNRLGEEFRLPYYQNEAKKISHYFSGHVWYHKRAWVLQRCFELGKAYQASGKEEYAARALLVLDRIAQVYPHYPVLQNSPRRVAFRESQVPPYHWDSGCWGYFHNEIPLEAIRVYDLVADSKALDDLSQRRGYDVRRRIEEDFFRAAFACTASKKDHVNNVVGYDVRSAAILGRVIGEPRFVHWAFGWMKENVDAGFFYDGMWNEAPSYHYMTIGGLKSAFESVRGYSDPPGHTDPVDGSRFDNLDPLKEAPFWGKVQTAPEVIAFPNGMSNPVHDTHPYERRSPARERTVSTLCPGFGHASLGRGAGPNQMQAQLHFSGAHGHAHYDSLNLTLWAKEREMLPDVGYTWTQMRYWTTCTLGHNTVVVDRKDQSLGSSDGDLLRFFPDTAGVSVVEADGRRAYANVAGLDLYRRLLVTIPVSDADAYVVDLFRVRGGAMHDWALHGDAEEDTTATCSLPLGAVRPTMLEPGEEWKEPTIEGATFNAYGMLRDARSAEAAGGFQVTFAYAGQPGRGLRAHVLPGGPAEVWLGRSPSVRRMGQGARGDMRKGYDFWMPHLLVRRRGAGPLDSLFTAVHEAYAGEPFLAGVTPLALTPADPGAIALQVRHGERVDTIISTQDEPPFPERVAANGMRLRGRLAVVREERGKVTAAWLFEGESLSAKDWRLAGDARLSGALEAATRKVEGAPLDTFLTPADLPAGEVLRGAWMVVTHAGGIRHAYRIDRVEKRNGKSEVVLAEDHGLKIAEGKTREVFFPRREFKGPNTFVIPLATTVRR